MIVHLNFSPKQRHEMPWKETVIVTWAPLQSDFHFRLWPLTPSRSLVLRRQSFQNLGLDNRAVGTKQKRSDPWLSPLGKTTGSSINLKVSSSTIRAPGVLRYHLKHCKNYIIGIPEQPSFSYPKCPAPFCLLKYITFIWQLIIFRTFHISYFIWASQSFSLNSITSMLPTSWQ